MNKFYRLLFTLGDSKDSTNLFERSNRLCNLINVAIGISMLSLFVFLGIHSLLEQTNISIASLRVLALFILSLFNLWLAYKKKHYLSKILTLFLPLIVFIIVPTLVGMVEEESFIYYPFIIVILSIFPQLLLLPGKEKILFWISIIYHFLLLLFIDRILVYFSPTSFIIIERIDTFYIYYKISHLLLFAFVNLIVFYLRKLNHEFESELTRTNSVLISQSNLFEQRNQELETGWQQLESYNVSLEVYKETLEFQNQELNMALTMLTEAQSKLVQTEKLASLGILVAGVAHEINNPLNYLAGGAQILETELSDLMQKMRRQSFEEGYLTNETDILRSIAMIKEGVSRLKSITQELNSYSAGLNLERKEENLSTIIEAAINILGYKITNDIIIFRKYELTQLLKVYPDKLNQVFINILDNAVFALKLKKKGIKQIDILTIESNGMAIIAITNNGPLMELSNINQIFDPFFTTKQVNEGNGLGMAISFNIIKDHKGDIEIINQEGRVGFQISIPIY